MKIERIEVLASPVGGTYQLGFDCGSARIWCTAYSGGMTIAWANWASPDALSVRCVGGGYGTFDLTALLETHGGLVTARVSDEGATYLERLFRDRKRTARVMEAAPWLLDVAEGAGVRAHVIERNRAAIAAGLGDGYPGAL